MATLEAIREGLAARLRTIPDVQVSEYLLSNPTPPCVLINSGPINPDATFGAPNTVQLTLIVYAGGVDVGAQKRLDRYRSLSGADSVVAAIDGDATLGATVDSTRVTEISEIRTYLQEANVVYVGCEFTVEVFNA